MHYAGTLGNIFHRDATEFGWQNLDGVKHDWPTMQSLIGNYIKSLNFSYKVQLRSAQVTYFDGLAQFIDEHTIEWKVIINHPKKATFSSLACRVYRKVVVSHLIKRLLQPVVVHRTEISQEKNYVLVRMIYFG